MSCKLLAHPSISTYICAINIVLAGPCESSTIPLITIFSVAVITSVFAVSFCLNVITFWPRAFPASFSALILFGGNWGVEISKLSCAGILLGDKNAMCNQPAIILGWTELTSMLSCDSLRKSQSTFIS